MSDESPKAKSPGEFFRGSVLPCRDDLCLIWPFARNAAGYGHMRVDGRVARVHRLACIKVHGAPPSRKHQAAHGCGRGKQGCVNPMHLRWATAAENMADCVAHGTASRGERQGNARLTETDILYIRASRGVVPQSDLAGRFGVTAAHISKIQTGNCWRHVDQ